MNKPNHQLELLTTDHCTLCEEAMGLLLSLPMPGWSLVTIDVALDEKLMAEFGARIPVLRHGETQLAWPFDRAAIESFIQARTASVSK